MYGSPQGWNDRLGACYRAPVLRVDDDPPCGPVTESVQFESRTVTVSPSAPRLPDLVAAAFQVCGKVDLSNLPDGVSTGPRYGNGTQGSWQTRLRVRLETLGGRYRPFTLNLTSYCCVVSDAETSASNLCMNCRTSVCFVLTRRHSFEILLSRSC